MRERERERERRERERREERDCGGWQIERDGCPPGRDCVHTVT